MFYFTGCCEIQAIVNIARVVSNYDLWTHLKDQFPLIDTSNYTLPDLYVIQAIISQTKDGRKWRSLRKRGGETVFSQYNFDHWTIVLQQPAMLWNRTSRIILDKFSYENSPNQSSLLPVPTCNPVWPSTYILMTYRNGLKQPSMYNSFIMLTQHAKWLPICKAPFVPKISIIFIHVSGVSLHTLGAFCVMSTSCNE